MEVAIRKALGKAKNGAKWESLVGYTAKDLQCHLSALMPAGMVWEDIMAGRAEVDHIVPKSLFVYDSHSHPAFKACWALSNLRPLWKIHNRAKSNKLELP